MYLLLEVFKQPNMEKTTQHIDSFVKEAGSYLENKKELFTLKAIDKVSDVASSTVSAIVLAIMWIIIFGLINFGAAFWIGEALGKIYLGFFIVAGFYILLAIILSSLRKPWLKVPLSNMLIKKLLK